MIKDLTNQKFGKLYVKEIDNITKNRAYWKCVCDCGNIVIRRSDRITRDKYPNCGCITSELLKKRIRDRNNLKGQKFGRLTVIKRIGLNKHFSWLWECKCDCGNETIVTTGSLRKKYEPTRSCGCLQRESAKIQGLSNSGENNGMYGMTREKHPSWKGEDYRSENDRVRKSKQYINWRNSIYERDNWTCQNCNTVGGKLNAHHIKEFAKYPELRFELNNGVTLCVECHKNVHKKVNNVV